MNHRIITISRQFGSGGRTVGKRLAETLGIPCYDSEIIQRIAERSGLAKNYIAEKSEYAPYASWIWGRDHNGHSVQDDLWAVQRQVIREAAENGPCVIVGRCADFILRDQADLLTVFIHADKEMRAKRIVTVYGEKDLEPEKRLAEKDKCRKAYYQFYTDMKWGDARHYHIALDSGKLGIDTCVSVLADLYRK